MIERTILDPVSAICERTAPTVGCMRPSIRLNARKNGTGPVVDASQLNCQVVRSSLYHVTKMLGSSALKVIFSTIAVA